MNKVRSGEYNAPSEGTLANWIGTTRNGSSIANIKATLNNHFGKHGSWRLADPVDKDAYLARVANDTLGYKQPVIQGVDTQYLPYYHGKSLNHFNWLYGFDNETNDNAPRQVYMGDGWDPYYIYGSSTYGNPYGHHKVELDNAFRASDRSGPAYNPQYPNAYNPRLIW